MSTTTKSPTLFLTSTAEQASAMTEGFIDRTMYKVLFKPLQINSFHKITDYVIKKTLCQPSIFLNCDNFRYLNHAIANESIVQILKRISKNISQKGKENYIQNNKLMKTLRIAIRDSKNINKTSKYKQFDQQNQKHTTNLWYFK